MRPITLLDSKHLQLTINRLCYQLIETHDDFSNSVIIGLQPRGVYLAARIAGVLSKILKEKEIVTGDLDITFHRDDFRRREEPIKASTTNIDFMIEGKRVVLVDDVLYTGRTVRAGLDAMIAFGRPESVELLVLIDRRFSRDFPIQPQYVGSSVDAIASQKVAVEWKDKEGEDRVILYTHKSKDGQTQR